MFDNYYAFTVGVLAAGSEDSTVPDPNATPFLISAPEPATLVLLGTSLSFIAFQTRRIGCAAGEASARASCSEPTNPEQNRERRTENRNPFSVLRHLFRPGG